MSMGPKSVYKICPKAAWQAAQADGAYRGSPDDVRDGFIHLSSLEQLAGTAARHFAGQAGLVVLCVDQAHLGVALKWEPSRGGALFPHLYGVLPAGAVTAVHDLPLGNDAIPVIPAGLA